MNYLQNLYTPMTVENLKIRRSKMILFGVFGCFFINFMIGFLMYISLHPEIATSSSLITTKASFFKETNWLGYFSVLMQFASALGLILFGFFTTWIFGREYSDRTVKDILALPMSRTSIILSKYIVVSFWSVLLTFLLFFLSIIVGFLLNISGWSTDLFFQVVILYTVTVVMVLAVTTPVAFVASIGKGYLASFSYIIFCVLLAQFINLGLPGLDPYVPWTIPVIFSTNGLLSSSNLPPLNPFSYVIILGTFLLGILGTIYFWNNVDQF